MRRLASLALVALAGCAATTWPRGEWTKPGVAAPVHRRDEYECERAAVADRRGAAVRARVHDRCADVRGIETHAVTPRKIRAF